MTKITKVVDHPLFKLISSILGFVFVGLVTIICYQGIARIEAGELATKDNKIAHEKLCDKTEMSLHEKVDVVYLERTLDYMEKKSDRQYEAMQYLMKRSDRIETKVNDIQTDVNDIKRKMN